MACWGFWKRGEHETGHVWGFTSPLCPAFPRGMSPYSNCPFPSSVTCTPSPSLSTTLLFLRDYACRQNWGVEELSNLPLAWFIRQKVCNPGMGECQEYLCRPTPHLLPSCPQLPLILICCGPGFSFISSGTVICSSTNQVTTQWQAL